MIEGVEISRDGDRFVLVLRGAVSVASGDGGLEVIHRDGIALTLSDTAAAALLSAARDVIDPWNEIRERVNAELEASRG